ncbi:hypothetical protein R3P38DRAFT_2994588 [Favolaschia claudopus]|uniref:Uncharacterized protein n=1 Tax=Favolaschia claudopus TaxID=2862362 RepID=A0AAW0ATH2_9AGAR
MIFHSFNSSTSSSSLPPEDLIRIDANYQTLHLVKGQWCKDPRYVLLRNFTVPPGAPLRQRLTVLDCAILASVISDRAEHYSQLGHMCMWFAATFYLAAYRICHNRAGVHMKSQEKREFRFAGKWKRFQMVDQRTGDLLLRQAESLQTLKEAIKKGMEKRKEVQENTDRYLRMVDEDAALWEENEKIDGRDTIGAIVVLFEARRKQIRQGMTDKIQLAQEARLQERLAIEEKARKEERQLAEQREKQFMERQTQLEKQLSLAGQRETQLQEQLDQARAELRVKAA